MRVVLDENAKMPTKAHDWDAGWDLYAREDFVVPACTYDEEPTRVYEYANGYSYDADNGDESYFQETVPLTDGEYSLQFRCRAGSACHNTGVHIEIPAGYVGFLKSKSGLNVKHGLTSDGVIDAGYTGSIVVKLYNHTDKDYYFNKGDKITQIVILPVYLDSLDQVSTLEATERGDNGFGSSGK